MSFFLDGVLDFRDACKQCAVMEAITNVLGTDVCLAWVVLLAVLFLYSGFLLWWGRRVGRQTPLVTVVSVQRNKSRFEVKDGSSRMPLSDSDYPEPRTVYSGSEQNFW